MGRGLARNIQPYGRTVWFRDRAQAWIGFEADGSLIVRTGVTDVGVGQAAALAQIAAEVLGVSLGRVRVHIGDSALTPLAGGTFATRQLYMSGNAVLKTAEELRVMTTPIAAALLEAAEPDVQLADDHARVAGSPARQIPLARVVAECWRRGVPSAHLSLFQGGSAAPVDLETGQGKTFPDFTFGCHAVEVEVDTETGRVALLKHVACHDVGRAINPQSVEGQIQGAAVMGAGQALIPLGPGLVTSGSSDKWMHRSVITAMCHPALHELEAKGGRPWYLLHRLVLQTRSPAPPDPPGGGRLCPCLA